MKIPWQLHLIAIIVIVSTLVAEGAYLFYGVKATIPEVLLGRILGTYDNAMMVVLAYYFTASVRSSSTRAGDTDPFVQQPKGPTA